MAFISKDRLSELIKEYPEKFKSLTTSEGERLFRRSVWITYMGVLLGKVLLFGLAWVLLSKIDHLWSELFAAMFSILTIKSLVDKDFDGLADSVISTVQKEFAEEDSSSHEAEKKLEDEKKSSTT